MSFRNKVLQVACLLTTAIVSVAVSAAPLDACIEIETDSARLACYDQASGRKKTTATVAGIEASAAPAKSVSTAASNTGMTPMQTAWGVPGDSGDLFTIKPYKPVYLMPIYSSKHVNDSPETPSQPVVNADGLRNTEAKFQLSFKTKLASNLFGDNGDLWAAYTQSSRWQVYAKDISRPFRETNYEPEAMFVWKTQYDLLGMHMRYAGIGLNHQSNGRADPLSRNWNRVIGQVGLEKDDWTAMLRVWHRIKEAADKDDNPDIIDYAGRGDLLVTRALGNHSLTALIRPSFTSGKSGNGSLRLDWAFPLSGRLKGHVQWFVGKGESLIDYNHFTQALGLGISLVEWY